ncbi:hypothetical protein LBMAG53_32020 [Planctomycetota bacterium]|nr:hypothetical protein LBMAG53_32020 [Planctomycetota bacterium]
MRSFTPDADERSSGSWRPSTLAAAAAALHEDGVVALRQVVPPGPIATLCKKMLDDIELATAKGRVKNDFQGIRPPPCQPWLSADILNNDWVIAVTHAVLGDGLANVAYGSNTAYPGSAEQVCHADGGFLFPGLAHPSVSLVVNVPLVDVDLANGATKLWPKSHLWLNAKDHSRPTASELAVFEAAHPTERALTRIGDVVIRDPRLWHCGMPNTTAQPRPMIAMIHNKRCMIGGFCAEVGSEAFFDSHPVLRHRVEFVPAPIDYLLPHHSMASWCQPRPARKPTNPAPATPMAPNASPMALEKAAPMAMS